MRRREKVRGKVRDPASHLALYKVAGLTLPFQYYLLCRALPAETPDIIINRVPRCDLVIRNIFS